ncbi:arginyl-transferase family protein, partial [Sphingomonas sp. Sphisp140]|uniref:aspartate/glutamate leucyltransferase n=1 Tax=Sphingomonas sp. Sphisp140 TaxID=3243019 RepID=UPI0039AEF9AA
MTALSRFPRFFVTSPSPCPYLPGRQERKIFTELSGQHAGELNDALGRIGFRRSQSVAYRPSCAGCTACVSVRVVADEFKPNASQRKLLKRHSDLEITACKPWATEEQFALLHRYLSARHPGGGMAAMDENDYADMVEQSPVSSYVIEYREPSVNGERGRGGGGGLTAPPAPGRGVVYSVLGAAVVSRPGRGHLKIMGDNQR